jgi:transposase
MKTKETIGIDVSKSVIDVCIHNKQLSECFNNNSKGFKKMIVWVFRNTVFKEDETLFVFEHTGLYSCQLSDYLEKESLLFCIVSGLEIKRSLGIVRGKSDQVDAQRIALYGYRLREELKASLNSDLQVKKLHRLMTLRIRLVRQRAGFKSSLKEQKQVLKKKDYVEIFTVQESLINSLTRQIEKIEKSMNTIVQEDEELNKIYGLVTSVKGIGKQTALMMIVYTNRFTKFKTWRKFASFCGVAPFPHQSGSSIRGLTKVSHFANKELKSIINMCAVSAIKYNPEMKRYYAKRVEGGKNKMSTINIVRNKLISRVFAAVKRGTPYVILNEYA